MSHHFVALALQVVSVGQDKTLLASSGLNDLPRDGDLELFNVLRFNLDLLDRAMGGFGKPLRWQFASLSNCFGGCSKRVFVRSVSLPNLGVALTDSRQASGPL